LGKQHRAPDTISKWISNLQMSVVRYKNVVRFDVSVSNIYRVKRSQRHRDFQSDSVQLSVEESSSILGERSPRQVWHHIVRSSASLIRRQQRDEPPQLAAKDAYLSSERLPRMRKLVFTEKFDDDILPSIASLAQIQVAITSSL
jgi:hypothetical protein